MAARTALAIDERDDRDGFALRDGFNDWEDMAAFWRAELGTVDAFTGVLIEYAAEGPSMTAPLLPTRHAPLPLRRPELAQALVQVLDFDRRPCLVGNGLVEVRSFHHRHQVLSFGIAAEFEVVEGIAYTLELPGRHALGAEYLANALVQVAVRGDDRSGHGDASSMDALPVTAVVFPANRADNAVNHIEAAGAEVLDVIDVPVTAKVFCLGLARRENATIAATAIEGGAAGNPPIDLVLNCPCRHELLRHD